MSTLAAHLIHQMQRDPRLAWLIGPGSQTWDLATEAYAKESGMDVSLARDTLGKDLKVEEWPSSGERADDDDPYAPDTAIPPSVLHEAERLLLCGQRDAARQEILNAASRVIGRPL